jgi:hypothetical protein
VASGMFCPPVLLEAGAHGRLSDKRQFLVSLRSCGRRGVQHGLQQPEVI